MIILDFIAKLKFSDVISVFALTISGISIFWNIYRDIILKAKIKVNIQISTIVQPGNRNYGTFINISVVNHGPGSIICESVWVKKRSFWRWLTRKSRFAFVVHDYTNPWSAQLPKKLEVGEKIALLFSYEEKIFIASKPTHVGIMDSFGRIHWACSKSLKMVTKQYLSKFPEEKWENFKRKKGSE